MEIDTLEYSRVKATAISVRLRIYLFALKILKALTLCTPLVSMLQDSKQIEDTLALFLFLFFMQDCSKFPTCLRLLQNQPFLFTKLALGVGKAALPFLGYRPIPLC